MQNNGVIAYIGKWGMKPSSDGYGFSICQYNGTDGTFEYIKSALTEVLVGAAYVDKERNILYCVDERRTLPELNDLGGGGRVFAVKLDPTTGDMSEINHQPTFAPQPSYVVVDAERKFLVVTNHSFGDTVTQAVKDAFGRYHIVMLGHDASTVLYRLNPDGSIGEACDIYKHEGKGILPGQTSPHPHCVCMSPSGSLFAVCDTGTDQVYMFKIDREVGKLVLCGGKGYKSLPGSAPRYGVFHPSLPYFFFNHESKPIVCSVRYDESGALSPVCTTDVLPEEYHGSLRAESSDLKLHPSGRYLYNVIRGANYVSVFRIDENNGTLERIQTLHFEATTFCGGGARGCTISPDARFLYLSVTDDKRVLTMTMDENGLLALSDKTFEQPSPANITFFQLQH